MSNSIENRSTCANSNTNIELSKYPQPALQGTSVTSIASAKGEKDLNNNDNMKLQLENEGNPNINNSNVASDGNDFETDIIYKNEQNEQALAVGIVSTNEKDRLAGNGAEEPLNPGWVGWKSWNSKQVCSWLEKELLTNYGLNTQDDIKQVKKFVSEFEKHKITGKILENAKLDRGYGNLEYLKSGFSDQSMGLWLAVKDAVSHLP